MNLARKRARELTLEVKADIARIDALWSDSRERFGEGDEFLFGKFSAADAMFAPVATRIISYEINVSAMSQRYVETITALPAFQEWKTAGLAEPWVIPGNDPD